MPSRKRSSGAGRRSPPGGGRRLRRPARRSPPTGRAQRADGHGKGAHGPSRRRQAPGPLPDAQAIEAAVLALPGIEGCRVVLGRTGEIRELHAVTADAEADPRQLVRKIETALAEAGAPMPDHRRISLVRLRRPRRARQAPRPRLVAVEHQRGRLTVTLEHGGTTWLGSLQIAGDPGPQDAARAALLAARALISQEAQSELQVLQELRLSDVNLHLAAVRLLRPDREETLLGTALLGADPLLSAARAVLDALNRHLGAA